MGKDVKVPKNTKTAQRAEIVYALILVWSARGHVYLDAWADYPTLEEAQLSGRILGGFGYDRAVVCRVKIHRPPGTPAPAKDVRTTLAAWELRIKKNARWKEMPRIKTGGSNESVSAHPS